MLSPLKPPVQTAPFWAWMNKICYFSQVLRTQQIVLHLSTHSKSLGISDVRGKWTFACPGNRRVQHPGEGALVYKEEQQYVTEPSRNSVSEFLLGKVQLADFHIFWMSAYKNPWVQKDLEKSLSPLPFLQAGWHLNYLWKVICFPFFKKIKISARAATIPLCQKVPLLLRVRSSSKYLTQVFKRKHEPISYFLFYCVSPQDKH